MPEIELKACRHCGGEPTQPYFGERVECANRDCQSSTPTIAAWNTRPTPDLGEDELVSRLRLFGKARPQLALPVCDQAADRIEQLSARVASLNAECERAWEAYRIAHDQAMANGSQVR